MNSKLVLCPMMHERNITGLYLCNGMYFGLVNRKVTEKGGQGIEKFFLVPPICQESVSVPNS